MKKAITTLGLAVSALLGASPAAAGIVVTFTPSAQHVNVGELAWVDANITGLGAEVLAAFDLNFLYNSAVMGSNRVIDPSSVAAELGTLSYVFVDLIVPGNWGLQGYATDTDDVLAANQADSFLLARFNFLADADGVSTFTLGLDPDFERNFVGLNFQSLNVTVNSACIAVGTGACSSVPEPGSFGLASLALLGLFAPAALRRRGQPS